MSPAVTVTHPLRKEPSIQLRQVTRDHTENQRSDTLVIFFGWLGAKSRDLGHHFNLYQQHCVDVLFIPGKPIYFVWSASVEDLCHHLLKYLCRSDDMKKYKKFLIHSISIGASVFVYCQMRAQENLTLFSPFIEKISGIILDSPVYESYETLRMKVSRVIVKNPVLQVLIPILLSVYFYLTWQYTVKYLEKVIDFLENNPLPVPYLFFISNDDPICDAEGIVNITSTWRTKRHSQVWTKCLDKSVHAAHLKYHPKEYIETIQEFLTVSSSFIIKSKL